MIVADVFIQQKKQGKKITYARKRTSERDEVGDDDTILKKKRRQEADDADSHDGEDANVRSGSDDDDKESAKESFSSEYDLTKYEYLKGETHYDEDKDEEDCGVFKCMRIAVENDKCGRLS